MDQLDDAIAAWSSIRRDDDPNAYAWAQSRLGFAYQTQNKLDEAITAWSNIRREDEPELYAEAQRNLALVNKH